MDRKILRWILMVLGLSSALASIGIGIYTYNNPLAENVQFLLQIPLLLILVALISGFVLD